VHWNFADVYEAIAAKLPDAPCQAQGDRTLSWAEFDRGADALARHLLDAGLGHQAKVAVYLTNCPEYLQSYLAAFKAGLVPVNTNYRYGPEEIAYLFDNADAEAVVFHAQYGPLLEDVRHRLPRVRTWLAVEDGDPLPDRATGYADVVAGGAAGPVVAPWGRSGDDLLLLYTGGTTGMPKGVMWRQHDLFKVLGRGGNPLFGRPPAGVPEEIADRLTGPGPVIIPACPLMHGTGQLSCLTTLNEGGSVVVLPRPERLTAGGRGRGLDPERLWDEVERRRANVLVIVGDSFARPLVAALDAEPGRWDLSSLRLITSSGAMWSQQAKEHLLHHLPSVLLFDSLGSSEAVGLAQDVSRSGTVATTATFSISDRVQVLGDDGRPVRPGSEEVGMVSIRGALPLGYYKDEEKSRRTFREVDGIRWSTPGDLAQVRSDGTIRLLGRGSAVINTGGEKVFPEEVEEVLKEHPSVQDVACLGLPDERFGEAICALVEPVAGATVDPAALVDHVKGRLASYKAPKTVLAVDTIGRAPNGKVDYARLRRQAEAQAGAGATGSPLSR
jgi:acyl-CoA synthetase (AMP-forming)/AMP-acid ligase II